MGIARAEAQKEVGMSEEREKKKPIMAGTCAQGRECGRREGGGVGRAQIARGPGQHSTETQMQLEATGMF